MGRILVVLVLGAAMPSAYAANLLLSTFSSGNPDAILGGRNTLDEVTPGRFRLVYGDLFLCVPDSECNAVVPNPEPPIATLWDFYFENDISETFTIVDGPEFDQLAALATNGVIEPMNHAYAFGESGGSGFSLEGTERGYYGGADHAGYAITKFELIFDATFDSPGRDPNGDGIWTDKNIYWTFNVYGNVVPIPGAAWLFASALALLGWIRARTS